MKRLVAAGLATLALGAGAALAATTSPPHGGTDVLCHIPTNTPPPAAMTPDSIRDLCNLPTATR